MSQAIAAADMSEEKGTPTQASVSHDKGVKVEKSMTIERSPKDLYAFWHDFENLPRVMKHLESVQTVGSTRSHWVARALAGAHVEWDAEIINDVKNELIAWRSVEGADVANAGSVHFMPRNFGRGTVVKVILQYEPPAGKLGAVAAKFLGEEPSQQVKEDLRRFKAWIECGQIPTTEGQPEGDRRLASRVTGGDGK